ncbi:MAG: hypothetical protein UDO91_05730 [Megasphaera elsdenii]|nr:hypothetical protein [Megasphaera elsdenii]
MQTARNFPVIVAAACSPKRTRLKAQSAVTTKFGEYGMARKKKMS